MESNSQPSSPRGNQQQLPSAMQTIMSQSYAGRQTTLNDASVTNPMGKFPRRKDPLHSVWFARDAKAALHVYEQNARYLAPFKKKFVDGDNDQILPDAEFAQSGDFGVLGHDKVSALKRAYRDLQANTMFRVEEPVKAPPIVANRRNNFKRQKSPRLEESRWEKKSKEYVLLRRDEVEELRGMEKLLREEKKVSPVSLTNFPT